MPGREPPLIALPWATGSYALRIRLGRECRLTVGKLGPRMLPAGRYLYCGSARAGLAGRIRRHLKTAVRGETRPHWHVDYVLAAPCASVDAVYVCPPVEDGGASECDLVRVLSWQRDVTVPIPAFGASDCHAGCLAHLLHSPRGRPWLPGDGEWITVEAQGMTQT